jgi:hypothetical protein
MTAGGDDGAGKGERPERGASTSAITSTGTIASTATATKAATAATATTGASAARAASASSTSRPPRWQQRRLSALREPLDFIAFIVRPTLRRGRGRRRTGAIAADWASGLRPARLLLWLVILWTVNFTLLGPLAVDVANHTGVERARTILPAQWPYVVLWAPLIEEMLFRFWLRRPRGWPLYVFFAACGFMVGPSPWLVGLVGAVVGWHLARRAPRAPWRRKPLRRYHRHFPVILHLSVLAFALMHLGNYSSAHAPWWLLPLVVLPQWFTGMVLAWTRVRHGIGAAIVLHAGFNALPLILLRLI